jgi:FtsP/CotA-like multicopper oxidase with cupredoxin domain
MGGGGGGAGSTGTLIDPPIGASFADPVEMENLSSVPGVVEAIVEAKLARVNLNDKSANLMTFNGTYPAPTIRAHRGDKVRILYVNSLPTTAATNLLGYQRNVTNLHTHGWHVSPEPPADFVMYELAPGSSREHEYDLALQPGGTLSFYHPHIHGLSAEQYWAGMVGALVVEDETAVLAPYETHIMILKDIALNGSEPAPHAAMHDYMQGKEGDVIMVNGQVNPRLPLKADQVQRWRILNASNARFYRLALESHQLHLIGTDGGLLDKPYAQNELLLSPGERVDVLVKATQGSGSFKLKALPYARMGMSTTQTVTLLTAVYEGRNPQALPTTINPTAQRLPVATSMLPRRRLVLSMGAGNGYINGQDYDVNPYMIMSELGTSEVWEIVNNSGMDHPFHQHVNSAQVLSIAGGDAAYRSLHTSIPGWKDTVLVPKMGSVTMLIPIRDYDGMAMFHCHILEHEDIGMMGVWHLMAPMMGDDM